MLLAEIRQRLFNLSVRNPTIQGSASSSLIPFLFHCAKWLNVCSPPLPSHPLSPLSSLLPLSLSACLKVSSSGSYYRCPCGWCGLDSGERLHTGGMSKVSFPTKRRICICIYSVSQSDRNNPPVPELHDGKYTLHQTESLAWFCSGRVFKLSVRILGPPGHLNWTCLCPTSLSRCLSSDWWEVSCS